LQQRWLEVCSIHRQLVPVQPFSTMPGSKLFSGMRFSASGLVKGDKIKLAALVTYHGGEYSRSLDDKCTHLVTHRAVGEKYQKSLSRPTKVTCVTPGWVLTSAKNRVLKNTADYDPANVIPGSEILPEMPASQTSTMHQPATPITTTASQPLVKQATKAVRNIRRKKSPNTEKRSRAKPSNKKSAQNQHHQQPIQHPPHQQQPNQTAIPVTNQSAMMQPQTTQAIQQVVQQQQQQPEL